MDIGEPSACSAILAITTAVRRNRCNKMKRLLSLRLIAKYLFWLALLPACAIAQGSYTAASCNYSDVNAVINGPTHTAVNGDTINIPAGSCTWTSGLLVNGVGIDITGTGTPNIGGGTVGAGAANTTIIDAIPGTYQTAAALITFENLTPGQTAKVELLTLSASGAAANQIPEGILITGNCATTAPYCASARVDNINFSAGTWWPAATYGAIAVDDVFGVIDHNTMNETENPGTGPLVTVNNGSWQGVGLYGDNSMASADTFGTAQEIYIENNSISGARGTDTLGGSGARVTATKVVDVMFADSTHF